MGTGRFELPSGTPEAPMLDQATPRPRRHVRRVRVPLLVGLAQLRFAFLPKVFN